MASVVGVGTATIAAAIGAGGLGEYIFRGLSMVDATTILAGAIPAAALALAVDGLLALARARAAIAARRHPDTRRGDRSSPSCSAPPLLSPVYARGTAGAVVVGSKNFTEQVILGEILRRHSRPRAFLSSGS